jgi:hypothetical protein
MKTAPYARLLFGASALMLGVVMLIWRDPSAWEGLPLLKLGAIVATCIAIAQIGGGLGMLVLPGARWAPVVLAIVYAIFALASVPDIVTHPTSYVVYGSFFEWFSLVCGATALFVPRAARVGYGLCAVSFTLGQIFYPRLTASLVPTWIPPSQMFWVILTTIAFGLAAIAILVNVRARLALRLLTLMLALFGLLVWVPLLVTHPQDHFNWAEFAENYLIAAAAWMVADRSAEASIP